MFKALKEMGLERQITMMSGCSIGAYAAAICAVRGLDAYRDFLGSFMSMAGEGEVLPDFAVEEARSAVGAGNVPLSLFVSERRFWKFEALGLHRYFDTMLSHEAVMRAGIRLNVCAYSLELQRPTYFELSQLSQADQTRALIASGSLEFLFPPVEIQGIHYLDGGMVPSICTAPAPPDKIPVFPLRDADVDFVLINYLIAQDTARTELVPPSAAYLELRPSSPLEAFPGAGTLDFSAEKLIEHENKGYADTIRLFRDNCTL